MSYLEGVDFVVDPRDYRAFDLIFVSPRPCLALLPSQIILQAHLDPATRLLHQHFKENPYFSNQTLTKSYVPTSGPPARIGLTASELIGHPRPSGISTYTPTPSSNSTSAEEKVGGLKVDRVEGEREWDLKQVELETEDNVREAIAFFDEMDDLVGLVRTPPAVPDQVQKHRNQGRLIIVKFPLLDGSSFFPCAARLTPPSRRWTFNGSRTKSTYANCSLRKMLVSLAPSPLSSV